MGIFSNMWRILKLKIINKGTICCERCGSPIYDYVEFDNGRGGLDGEITHEYCRYKNDICQDCLEKEEGEE